LLHNDCPQLHQGDRRFNLAKAAAAAASGRGPWPTLLRMLENAPPKENSQGIIQVQVLISNKLSF